MAPNVPATYEMHFGVPMVGAVLNTLNIRHDAHTMYLILNHSEAKVAFVDGPILGSYNGSSQEPFSGDIGITINYCDP